MFHRFSGANYVSGRIYQISTEPQQNRVLTRYIWVSQEKLWKLQSMLLINISQILQTCQTKEITSILKLLDFHQLMVKSLICSWRQNMTKLVFLHFSPFFCSPKNGPSPTCSINVDQTSMNVRIQRCPPHRVNGHGYMDGIGWYMICICRSSKII